jgi:hypothetical protein
MSTVSNSLSVNGDSLRVGGESVGIPQPSERIKECFASQNQKLTAGQIVDSATCEPVTIEQ